MSSKSVGAEKEALACDYLRARGVKILEQNFRFHKIGEIDIVGEDNGFLVFFEVKYRTKSGAVYAVNKTKQRQISKVALGYIMGKQLSLNTPVRFDVIAIDNTEIEWYKNAFSFVR